VNFGEEIKEFVLNGGKITKVQALSLYEFSADQLGIWANEIREKFCSDSFDICSIINGKSGGCSENCKFCAQSGHSHTDASYYPLLPEEEIINQAEADKKSGILRFSIVTSGKALNDSEVEKMCSVIKKITENVGIKVCGSFGLLNENQFRRFKEAGLTRVHNNIETSERNFPNICTTHTFEDKITAIKNAKKAGLSVCSGGIIGMGETLEDRIDMAFTIRDLGIKSMPVNILNPIKGTPFENVKALTEEEILKTIAIFRFIIPDGAIRLAGGRGLLSDKGERCFLSGANAAISGDMLTTSGISTKQDFEILEKLGYKAGFINE
jgi:biotin synthase